MSGGMDPLRDLDHRLREEELSRHGRGQSSGDSIATKLALALVLVLLLVAIVACLVVRP